MIRQRAFFLIFILGTLAWLGWRNRSGPLVDTGLLSLLPSNEKDPSLAETHTLLTQRGGRLMAFAVTRGETAMNESAGQRLRQELQVSSWVKLYLTHASSDRGPSWHRLFFPHRYQLLSEKDRDSLARSKGVERLLGRMESALFQPSSSFFSSLITEDPLLFFPEYLRSAFTSLEGFSKTDKEDDEKTPFFLALEWNFDPFDSLCQERFYQWWSKVQKKITQEFPQVQLHTTGLLSFARAQRIQTEKDLFLASLGSFLGVLALLAWGFRSFRSIGFVFLPAGVGLLMGLAATWAVFGSVHVVTLTFGTTLIGCAVDYPIHFLSHRLLTPQTSATDTFRHLAPGLRMGLGTSVLGYLVLGLADFPGLRQIALFSSVGLVAAFVTVWVWFPRQTPGKAPAPPAGVLKCVEGSLRAISSLWHLINKNRRLLFWGAGILSVIGLGRCRFDDDLRRFQNPPASVQQEDAEVRRCGPFGGHRFILIRGKTQEETLQTQETLYQKLLRMKNLGDISSFQCLAPFLPSEARQNDNLQRVQDSLLPAAPLVRKKIQALGLSTSVADRLFNDLKSPPASLSPEQWLESPASEPFRSLWLGKVAGGFAGVALVGGLRDRSTLEEALKPIAGVHSFDQTEEYNRTLSRYRKAALGLLGVSVVLATLLLMAQYGARGATLALTPSLVGVLLTFSGFGWAGEPLHLFHVLAAVLVFAMGVDYAIFFLEASRVSELLKPALLSVSLSATTTLVSFGFLGLCRTPVVHTLGQTIFWGLLISYLLSPLPWILQRDRAVQ